MKQQQHLIWMIRRAVIHVREYEKRAETYPSNWITGDSEILVRMFWRLVGAIILRITGAKERPSEKGRCPMHLLGWWGRSSGPILNSWISSSISMNHSTVQYSTAQHSIAEWTFNRVSFYPYQQFLCHKCCLTCTCT